MHLIWIKNTTLRYNCDIVTVVEEIKKFPVDMVGDDIRVDITDSKPPMYMKDGTELSSYIFVNPTQIMGNGYSGPIIDIYYKGESHTIIPNQDQDLDFDSFYRAITQEIENKELTQESFTWLIRRVEEIQLKKAS